MSHEATNWAIKQRGLKPAAKVVLWHLCDRYHPDHGCFPSLDTLADDCEMSRRSVQDQVEILVASGLVSVEKMPRQKGQMPRNRYRFSFENSDAHLGQNLPEAKSAFGKKEPQPLANSDTHLGQNLPTNPVREPLREPVSAAAPEPAASSQPSRRELILEAIGIDGSGITPAGKFIGTTSHMAEPPKWDALGLTEDEQLAVIRDQMTRQRSRNPNFMPGSFAYFSGAMADLAAAKTRGIPASSPAFSQQSELDQRKAKLRKLAGMS